MPVPAFPETARRRIALVGLESVGKSALFRNLSGHAAGDEANVRGSTFACRTAPLSGTASRHEIVDTPGLRTAADTAATRLALGAFAGADALLLVARGTHAASEVETLLRELPLAGRRSALVLTFADKAPPRIPALAAHFRTALGIPVVVVDARRLDAAGRAAVLDALDAARPLADASLAVPASLRESRDPVATWFDRPSAGPWLAFAAVLALFAVPVWLAYAFASWAQPLVDDAVITPLVGRLSFLPPWPAALLTGGYGVLTLGWYSFLWAFPVVLLIGLAVAAGEESGLKDRVTNALDPWLRRIGLAGRDLVPVLTGFGCNVVAVQQTRACSGCTRRACVSLIAFGSACSYQIGATLSLFGSGGHGLLFAPYLAALFVVGAVHTRLWHRPLSASDARPLSERAFLQLPSPRAVWWRVRGTLRQFLFQAMPVFLVICLAAAALARLGALDALARASAPVLALLGLPGESAPGVIFSLVRKDGLLALNADGGAFIHSLSAGQTFLLVWLASTLSACLVTLATVARELGLRTAGALAVRQAVTALVSTSVFAFLLRSL